MTMVALEPKPQTARFAYEVDRIRERSVRLNQEIPVDWLAAQLDDCEYEVTPIRGHINLSIEASGAGLWVSGYLEVEAFAECGICLARAPLPLKSELRTYLFEKTDGTAMREDEELTPEDLDKEWFEGDTVVLDGLIRDAIMIELPMTPRCGSDCSGPAGYVDREDTPDIDPRLAPLARLKIEKE